MTEEQAKSIYKDVARQFGFVDNPTKVAATYLLRNGKFLDTCGGYIDHQHINIAEYISKTYKLNDVDSNTNGSKFLANALGAVRITCWDSGKQLKGIYLPEHELSERQYTALEFFIALIAKNVSEEWPLLVATNNGEHQIEYKKSDYLEDRVIADIEHYYYSHKLELTENLILHEDTRNMLVSKSRNVGPYIHQERGKNRFERKRYSQIARTVKQYNQINMNQLFKEDLLVVHIPVQGETDSYTVSIKMEGVIAEIAKNIKNNKNQFEYRTVIQALTKVFNTSNIYVKCTCDDYKYRFAHWNIVNNVSVDDTASDPGPGKGIRNPNDDKGRGCKHVLLVLANGDWLLKVASVISNYVHYAEEHLQKPFLKLIFPKLYGIPADEMVEQDLIDTDEYLDSSVGLIDAINEYGKTRGQYKKGSNKNPVTGTGGKAKKEEKPAEKAEEKEENNEEGEE